MSAAFSYEFATLDVFTGCDFWSGSEPTASERGAFVGALRIPEGSRCDAVTEAEPKPDVEVPAKCFAGEAEGFIST